MKNTVIIDIDGTISKVGERLKYLQSDPPDWDSFYNDCFDDEPIREMVALVIALFWSGYYEFVFCTGRRESCRKKTMEWLKLHLGKSLVKRSQLLMRADGDLRHDIEVKPELLDKAGITPDDVAFMLEDRSSMVKKWRELGYTCLQVADGDF